jgi:integrase
MDAVRTRHRTRYPGIYYRLVDETKPDGLRRYVVWYSDANGQGHTQTLPVGTTLEDARLLQGQLQARKAGGESLLRARMTVGELLDRYLDDRRDSLSENTIAAHEWGVKVLKDSFGQRKLTELSPSDVARLVSLMQKSGKKASTIRRVLAPLSGAFRVAVRDGLVSSSPVGKLLPHEKPKGPAADKRCLSRAEIESLLASTLSQNGKGENLQWKALFSTLVFAGLRISEALALTWDDVTEEGLVVRRSKTEAGERTVMLIPAVRRLLSELKLSQAPGVQFVFATQEGAPLGRRNALRALHACCDRAGLPKYSLHELRHTFASILIAQRELPTLVARQMGHADPSITMKVYAHLFEEQESVDLAQERLEAAMGGMV